MHKLSSKRKHCIEDILSLLYNFKINNQDAKIWFSYNIESSHWFKKEAINKINLIVVWQLDNKKCHYIKNFT
jgi:hypothetical protein